MWPWPIQKGAGLWPQLCGGRVRRPPRAVSSFRRAPVLQTGGGESEARTVHQFIMPNKNTEARRSYLRNYQREWIKRRRTEWIKANGPCRKCGSWKSPEVDHIDPTTKEYEPAHLWSLSRQRREKELVKCQVLCEDCHKEKTRAEQATPLIHGTLKGYKTHDCHCIECRRANADWKAENEKKHRET